ncbi:MAG TPA: hypothetical protein VGU19_15835 [Microvirga sp.]|jgi:hypothetical protein|nr:hypothetical protein [Microvirga sp.]
MTRKPASPNADDRQEELDRELDEELAGTFPASDPPKVTRVPQRSQITGAEDRKDGRQDSGGKPLRKR